MQDELSPQSDQDERLHSLLKTWTVPEVRPSLDARVMASFRAHRPTAPFWKRFFSVSISVPVPVAAFIALMLISIPLLAWYRFNSLTREYTASLAAAAQTPSSDISEKKDDTLASAMKEPKEALMPQEVSAPQSSRSPKSALRVARLNSKPRTSGEMTASLPELDLTDFKPAAEIKVSVIRRNSDYENNN